MFGKSYTLFRLLGFEVRLDPTWLILGVLVTWTLAEGLFPFYFEGLSTQAYWAMGVAGAVGLLVSIVFHEFSHSLVARRYGLPIKGITLFIFGGVAQMDEEPASPKAEFLMAVAGPIASIVLAVALYGLYRIGSAAEWVTPVNAVFFYLAYLNMVLAVFNLVPAFPLDGGRMLRAALWGWKADLRSATRSAARIGSGFGIVLIVLGILSVLGGNFIGGMWWFLIGMFLRSAAQSSYQQVLLRQMLQGEPVRRFMQKNVVSVPPSLPLREFVEDYVYKFHYKMFPVVEDRRLLGWVSTRELHGVAKEDWDRTTVDAVYEPSSAENTVRPDSDAVEALSLLHRTGRSRLVVVEDDRVAGILTLKDLMHFLSLKVDLDELAA
ncbi:MAG: CBS domain-containing protein [Gammaproteobacteria bacterium]|nr:CBS domain-containing protein [Gammaproteobacteria bacterium]NIR98275.1 CBS domain-containing protein [Gammaproteobacteria bacterium]NIT63950.1 CBS domain-containing protein [Gammaproteobacteria bacterium]NIV20948.1 CBS domain-containing protein [Gammaproteobacteria bacterium]NIX10239.1 CBS domain-containing protein [Gammaproteobacteria bacterium]